MSDDASTRQSVSIGVDSIGESAIAAGLVRDFGGEPVLRAVVDHAIDCFLIVDEEGTVCFANPAVESVFGYDPESLVGQSVTMLGPERSDRRDLVALIRNLGTVDRNYDEVAGLRADRTEVPLAVSVRDLIVGGRRYRLTVMRDVSRRRARRAELRKEQAFVESMFDSITDLVYAFDRNGQFLRWNDQVLEVTGYTDAEIADMHPLEFVDEGDHERISAAITRVLEAKTVETEEFRIVTADGTRIPYEFTGAPLTDEDGDIVGITGVGRDITDRKKRERELTRQRDELRRLDRINRLIREVDHALIQATTEEAVVTGVPESIAGADDYVGAVVGEFDPDGTFAVRAAAGVDSADGALLPAVADGDGPTDPGRTAAESRSGQVEADLRDDDRPDTWRAHASREGYRAVAAVPLATGGRSYGVLGVYSAREDGFADRELAVLAELGEGIGNALRTAQLQRLLYAETVVELEMRTTGGVFSALSDDLDCRIDIERSVPLDDGLSLHYVTVESADPERISTAATDAVERVRRIDGQEGGGTFEFRVHGATPMAALTEYGARIRKAVAEEGTCHVVVEVAAETEVRDLVTALRERFPGTDLVRKRKSERQPEFPEEIHRNHRVDLTDRQRTALEAAYSAGYFEWPSRDSTAEDVAEAMDVTPQTLHQHLRVGLRKVLADFLEAGNPPDEGV